MAVTRIKPVKNTPIASEVNLDEYEAQATEALGGRPGVTVHLRNGDSVTIPHPMLIDEDVMAKIDEVSRNGDLDKTEATDLRDSLDDVMVDHDEFKAVWKMIAPWVRIPEPTIDGQPAPVQAARIARAVLGDEDYERFKAGGGTPGVFGSIWDDLTKDRDDPKPRR